MKESNTITNNIENSIYEMQKQKFDAYIDNKKITEEQASSVSNASLSSYNRISIAFARVFEKRKELIIAFLYVLYTILLFDNIVAFINSLYYLTPELHILNPYVIITKLTAPIITWIISTKFTWYNYKRYKFLGLYIVLINILVYLAIFFEILALNFIVPYVFKIPVGVTITTTMVIALARLVTAIFSIGLMLAFGSIIFTNIKDEMTVKKIMHFKVNRNSDNRPNKQFAYDMKIVRNMEDGSLHVIKEKDRSLHTLIDGASGTGKTSSCLTVAINDDFDQKIYNEDWQKKRLYKLLKKGKIRLTRDFEDIDFSANYFIPTENTSKKDIRLLKEIQTIAISAGVTTMAPNSTFADEIYELAHIKGLRVNRLDPELIDGKHKEGFIGFNPYYISPRLTGIEREMELFSRSTLVADVLQAIFDQSGSSDPYFAGLNQNITTTISSVLLLTYPALHYGKQPTLKNFQDIINDVTKIKPYRDELVRLYATKDGRNPDGSAIMDAGKANVGDYQYLLDTVDNELLGAGALKMFDQARGLRNIINRILTNPLVKDILCADNSIDMDEMLADGQITVVNYALKLGSAGMAFGLFFMLSFIKAVIRRPGTEKTRLPHYFYVDEFPTLLHPEEEGIFTYFRQFKTAATIALQTLDQMDKSKSTAFLKGVLVGNCANQIIFGRASVSEMQMYQDLAGTTAEVQEMIGTSETALSTENPSYTMSRRETLKDVNKISATDIRMRDFQEVTVFPTDKSSIKEAFHGRVDFLPKWKYLRKKRRVYNWHKYYVLTEGEEIQEGSSDISITSIPLAKTSVNNDTEKNNLLPTHIEAKTSVNNAEANTPSSTPPDEYFITATSDTQITPVVINDDAIISSKQKKDNSSNGNSDTSEGENILYF